MLRLERLNLDSSWKISYQGFALLIDPWLIGHEIDGFSWFNKQWHRTKPKAIADLGNYNGIVVSQPFSDHCHEQTLESLQPMPVYSAPNALKRLNKSLESARLQGIETADDAWLHVGPFRLRILPAPKQLKASFNGLIIACNDILLLYFPHGYPLTQKQLDGIQQFKTKVLITSFSTFKLPFFLGGSVNPGLHKSKSLAALVEADYLFQTHDEDKHAHGIVKKIAQTYYPSMQELDHAFEGRFVQLDMQDPPFVIS